MFDRGPTEQEVFANQREGYLFTYAQMCVNQVIRLNEVQSAEPPTHPISEFKRSFGGGKRAELLEIGITSVLSSALFFEAYSFDYVARKRSTTFAKKYFDKLDPMARWVLGTSLCSPPGLSPSDPLVAKVGELSSLRNGLVHNKTKSAASFYPPPEMPKDFDPAKCVALIYQFCFKLNEVDPSESFALYLARHISVWMNDAGQGINDYPVLANIDP